MSGFKKGDRVFVSDAGDASNYHGYGTVTYVTGDGWIVVQSDTGWDEHTPNFAFHAERVSLLDDPADSTLKPTNPKDAVGSDKLPVHLWPETATLMGSLALLDGALKYGRSNWRETGVRLSIYIDALRRHIAAMFEGEDVDPDSGVPHSAHALACLAIIVDAQAAGKLVDDRQYPGGYRRAVEDLTPYVRQLKAKHADKSPKHWTIQDVA